MHAGHLANISQKLQKLIIDRAIDYREDGLEESLPVSVPMGFEAQELEAAKAVDREDGLKQYAEMKQHMLARTSRFGALLSGYLFLAVSGPVRTPDKCLHRVRKGKSAAEQLSALSNSHSRHANEFTTQCLNSWVHCTQRARYELVIITSACSSVSLWYGERSYSS